MLLRLKKYGEYTFPDNNPFKNLNPRACLRIHIKKIILVGKYDYPNLTVYIVVSCCTQTLRHSRPRKIRRTRPLATRHHCHDAAACNIVFMHILLRMVFQQFILYFIFLPNRIPRCTFVV